MAITMRVAELRRSVLFLPALVCVLYVMLLASTSAATAGQRTVASGGINFTPAFSAMQYTATVAGSMIICTHAGVRFKCPVAHRSQLGVFKCALAIAGFIAGNAVIISKLRKAGGVWKVAKKLWKAKGGRRKAEIFAGIVGQVTGITAVVEGCS